MGYKPRLGKADPDYLVAVSNSKMYFRGTRSVFGYRTEAHTACHSGNGTIHPLPTQFAEPIQFAYADGQPILGPVSHGKTVFLAVSQRDPETVAVTGWKSVKTNNGMISSH